MRERLTLIYNTKTWHYKLILYVWGKNFFLDTSEIDMRALMDLDSTKLANLSWKQYPRIVKPRTVNFCPYWRAVIASVITIPLVFLWRLFPHKPKKARTHAEIIKSSERRSKITRYALAAGMAAFGVWKIIDGDWPWSIFYFLIAVFNLKSPEILKWTAKHLSKIYLPKRKLKKYKPKRKTVTPAFFKKLQEKHEIICPPIFFVEKKDAGELI